MVYGFGEAVNDVLQHWTTKQRLGRFVAAEAGALTACEDDGRGLLAHRYRLARGASIPSMSNEDRARDDTHRLLKRFGIEADDSITNYLRSATPGKPLRLRIVLEDLTEYESAPSERLRVEVEGEVGS